MSEFTTRVDALTGKIVKTPSKDMINHPPHYCKGSYETIEVIEDWKLEYHEASALKYISRAEHKGKRIEDLKKAKWFIERKIQLLEEQE